MSYPINIPLRAPTLQRSDCSRSAPNTSYAHLGSKKVTFTGTPSSQRISSLIHPRPLHFSQPPPSLLRRASQPDASSTASSPVYSPYSQAPLTPVTPTLSPQPTLRRASQPTDSQAASNRTMDALLSPRVDASHRSDARTSCMCSFNTNDLPLLSPRSGRSCF